MRKNTEILDLQQSKVQIELRLGNAYHTISIFDFCLKLNQSSPSKLSDGSMVLEKFNPC